MPVRSPWPPKMKPRFTSGLSASESAIICVSARTSIPSKLLRVMKFATPATASLPYSAEAPSVSISMRSIMIEGATLLMSTKPKPPSVVCRPPFNNTNVARGPSPRKLIVVVGELPMFTAPPPCWVLTVDTEPTFCGRFLNTSAIEPRCSRCSSSLLMTVSGCGRSAARSMKEPVTMISSSGCRAAGSCARTGRTAPPVRHTAMATASLL